VPSTTSSAKGGLIAIAAEGIVPSAAAMTPTAAKSSGHHFHAEVAKVAMPMIGVSIESHFISLMLHDGSKIYLCMLFARGWMQKCAGVAVGCALTAIRPRHLRLNLGRSLAGVKEAKPRIKSGVTVVGLWSWVWG